MKTIPLTLKQANQLIMDLHRHHKPVQGHRFSIGAIKDGELVGAVVVGRPVARQIDQNMVAEVTRLVTNGTPNTCSFLYSVAARVCREMGFTYIQTYILASEPGTSLKAAGWKFDGFTANNKKWTYGTRGKTGRREDQPLCRKQRWIKILNKLGAIIAEPLKRS